LTANRLWSIEQGSIIVVLGTDLPLLPIQLKRLARRIGIGIGRTGTPSGDNSGDIFITFSVANPIPLGTSLAMRSLSWCPNEWLDPVFSATVDVVEEAILNALVTARTMVGRDSHRVEAIDYSALVDLMRRYDRFAVAN
jgi:L-aminopeptidase/D-esterase-like protein